MRSIKDKDGREVAVTTESPVAKPKRPGHSEPLITTHNIEAVQRQREAEKKLRTRKGKPRRGRRRVESKTPKTALDVYRVQEEKIREDVAASEKHYNRIIAEQEKVRDAARVRREKGQEVLAGMTADFERIEAQLEAEETARLEAQDVTKKALDEGRTTAAEYFAKGISEKDAIAKAQAAAQEKLTDLRQTIRAKHRALLEAEAVELEAEYNIAFARTAPASAFRERLVQMLVALEASLRSPIGINSTPDVKARLDAKQRDLRNAQGKRLDSDGWQDYDLAGLKRLRLDPRWPEDRLPDLERIIAQARTNGGGCRLMLDLRGGKCSVAVMW